MLAVPRLSKALYQSWYDEKRVALGHSIDSVVSQLKALQTANSTRPLHYPSSKPITQDDDDELLILRLDMRLGASHQNESLQMLGKDTIALMLDDKISTSIQQLLALRERIDDPLSKILVTGDVNAGKSTFCNALLRRRILPENQQPCTAIFCEVLNASKNSGHEEVHGVTTPLTYDTFPLQYLEQVVTGPQYTQCKVFVDDIRTADESLLSNKEVVDITIIDAPGLNHNTAHTTAVFARQEEIDVVVFVVSAANHFTISAKDFIRAATAEKEYMFIVVNAFDTITDKERCKRGIMEQIQHLSPQTFKESLELVHFVSSNAVLAPNLALLRSSGAELKCERNKMKDAKVREFERLERSLRKFVLENRAKSKLAPARTYLLNILHDIHSIAAANLVAAQSELNRASEGIEEIVPQLKSCRKTLTDAENDIETTIENICLEVYNHCRLTIGGAIAYAGDEAESYDVPYTGVWTAFQYAEGLKNAMLVRIANVTIGCEDNARGHTTKGINAITQLGILHGRDTSAFERLHFRPEAMFSRKRDALAKEVDISIELRDFVDWPSLISTKTYAGAGMALTLATTMGGRLADPRGWLDSFMTLTRVMDFNSFHRVVVPGIVITVITTIGAYILQQVPQTIFKHLAAKVAVQLSSTDYVVANSSRITNRVRRVLRTPAENVRAALDRSVWDLGQRREEMDKLRGESHVAIKDFENLLRANIQERNVVEEINLEALPGTPE